LHPFRDDGIDEENRLREGWLKVLDWAIGEALSNSLMVVLDFHEFIAIRWAIKIGFSRHGNKWRNVIGAARIMLFSKYLMNLMGN
jgi:hypothetical protein